MKKMFVKIKESVEEKLRKLCSGLSPERVQEMEEFFNRFNQKENG